MRRSTTLLASIACAALAGAAVGEFGVPAAALLEALAWSVALVLLSALAAAASVALKLWFRRCRSRG